MRKGWLTLATLSLASVVLSVRPVCAASVVPPSPKLYVFDESGTLTERQSQALSTLLIEHDQASGDQLLIGVFRSLENEDASTRTKRVFEAWDSSRRAGGNGALLAVYLREKEARIEAGYGIGTRLSESAIRATLRDSLLPEIRAGQAYRALALSSLEMLRATESPLIESGRAEEILRAGGMEGPLKPTPPSSTSWLLWIVAGIALFGAFLYRYASAEAHFTSQGWFRPHAFLGLRDWQTRWKRPHDNSRMKIGGSDARW